MSGVNPETRPNWKELRFQVKKKKNSVFTPTHIFITLVTEVSKLFLDLHFAEWTLSRFKHMENYTACRRLLL